MTFRSFIGGLLAYCYNFFVGYLPVQALRYTFLRSWLGRFGRGSGVQIGCKLLNGRKIFLGERNVINWGCVLDGRLYNIITGSDVSIGPEATILTLGHDPQSPDFADAGGDVIIGDRVWIAYRATILPGVTIGEGAVVAAGAVVVTNVEPFTIVAGVPAKKIGHRNPNLRYRLDYHPLFT
jgi:maltose O-acetyltransferase